MALRNDWKRSRSGSWFNLYYLDLMKPIVAKIKEVFECLTNFKTQRVKLCLGCIRRFSFRKRVSFLQHDR